MTKPTTSVASEVRKLAKTHNVTAERDSISRLAQTFTRLSGDDVVLDSIEQLLVNLRRKGVMSTSEILALQVRYLSEKSVAKTTKKKLTA